MRKHKVLYLFTIFCLLLSVFLPIPVYAETLTFGQVLDELAKAQQNLKNNQEAIKSKENEVTYSKNAITSLKNEIQKMSDETAQLQKEIADSNIEIKEKQEQTKSMIAYIQMSQGDNIYLEYIFGGETITDFIYRLSVVEQITEYNENIIEELEGIIKANEKRKEELAKKQEESERKIINLNNQIESLNGSIIQMGNLSPSLEQEVQDQERLVEYYRSQGCSSRDQVIGRDCAVETANAIFRRPITTGYLTSHVDYRWGSFHRGLDMGSPNGRNTPIYSIGNGTLTSVYYDPAGALTVRAQYKGIDGQYYTALYAHLSRFGPGIYAGMEPREITSDTILGYMGDTGFAYGVHLHLEVWPCRYGIDSECSGWYSYVNFAERSFNNGFHGAESVISFPKTTYQYWYSR